MPGTRSWMMPRSRKLIVSVSEKTKTAYQATRGLGHGSRAVAAWGRVSAIGSNVMRLPTPCCAMRILNSRGRLLLHCLRTESRLGGKPLIYGRFSSSNRPRADRIEESKRAEGGMDSMVDVAET